MTFGALHANERSDESIKMSYGDNFHSLDYFEAQFMNRRADLFPLSHVTNFSSVCRSSVLN